MTLSSLDRFGPVMDHIIPLSVGGRHDIDNLQIVHSICNVVKGGRISTVSYTHLRAHETVLDLVCRLLLEKKKTQNENFSTHTHLQHIKILQADDCTEYTYLE